MTRRLLLPLFAFPALLALADTGRSADTDWPQWRGANRDGRVTGFKAPAAWPKELKKGWSVAVGDGVATPALVGDRLYVFTREGGSEVTRCLEAATGKEVWKEKYDTPFSGGGDRGFPGPRSSPAVAEGKVVTLGVNGTLSCLNAADGKKVWRVETKGTPTFHTSSSPIIVDKTVVAQFGGEKNGGIAAYELESGKEKWKWTDEGTAYASPTVMTAGDTKMVVAETDKSVVGIGAADGKLLWKTPFPVGGGFGMGGKGGKGGGFGYNASTPVVEGQTVYFSGSNRGTKALKVEKSGDGFTAKEVWSNPERSVKFSSPVVRKGVVYGLTARNELYAISAETGKGGWAAEVRGKDGYGSVVDVGPVLMSLTPAGQLVVFEPDEKEYKEVAAYKVSGTETYAYPVVSGNRVYIKDKDSLTLFTIE